MIIHLYLHSSSKYFMFSSFSDYPSSISYNLPNIFLTSLGIWAVASTSTISTTTQNQRRFESPSPESHTKVLSSFLRKVKELFGRPRSGDSRCGGLHHWTSNWKSSILNLIVSNAPNDWIILFSVQVWQIVGRNGGQRDHFSYHFTKTLKPRALDKFTVGRKRHFSSVPKQYSQSTRQKRSIWACLRFTNSIRRCRIDGGGRWVMVLMSLKVMQY